LEISLTWGDVLAHSLIGLGVAFVVFLLSLVYRRAAPWVSDYWARRSVSAAKKQLPRLERLLAEYESDFADPKLFIARIIIKSVATLVLFIATTLFTVIAMGYYVISQIQCEGNYACTNPNLISSVLILLITVLFEFLFFVVLSTLTLEASPEKYRARMGQRIARLRDRIVEE
jgi:multisubunit Na+/H+ antiporter MnhB subunit